jgi:hypothetical protein
MKNYKKAFAIFWIAAFLAIPAFMWAAETWNEATPAGDESPTLGDDRTRELKRAIRERLAVDHDFEASESPAFGDANATIGMHEGIRLKEQASSPTTIADQAGFWAADDGSGNTELFMRGPSDASAVQLTESNCGKIKSEAVDFSKDGTITITDTGDVDYQFPLAIYNPNLSATKHAAIPIGVAGSQYNSGIIQFYYAGDGSTDNLMSFGLFGYSNALIIDGSSNIGIGGQSDGAKLKVTGTSEITDTLTLSKSSGNGLVVTSNVDFNGNQDVAGTSNIHDTLTLSKASGNGLSVTNNAYIGNDVNVAGDANITGDIEFNAIVSGATKEEINSRCDGVPSHDTDSNAGGTVGAGTTQYNTLDLGTVTSGDYGILIGTATLKKITNAGLAGISIDKASGTGSFSANGVSNGSVSNIGYWDVMPVTVDTSVVCPFTITGTGTLVMELNGYSSISSTEFSSMYLRVYWIKKQ